MERIKTRCGCFLRRWKRKVFSLVWFPIFSLAKLKMITLAKIRWKVFRFSFFKSFVCFSNPTSPPWSSIGLVPCLVQCVSADTLSSPALKGVTCRLSGGVLISSRAGSDFRLYSRTTIIAGANSDHINLSIYKPQVGIEPRLRWMSTWIWHTL